MSSLPGLDLEDFVAWNFDLVVVDRADPNPSLRIAEALGTATKNRIVITEADFKKVVEPFEPFREDVERRLGDFSEEDCGSWRDYSEVVSYDIPDEVFDTAFKQLPVS